MKNIKRLFVAILLALCLVTVSSCGKRNSTVPYGSVTDTTYASASGYSVTQKEIYDSIRASGYSTILEKIKQAVFAKEIAEVNYATNSEDKIFIDEIVAAACYGTLKTATLEGYSATEIDTYKQKYIDTMFHYGITVTKDELNFTTNDEQVAFSNLGTALINYYAPERGYAIAAKADLLTVVDQETVLNDDDEEIDNTYYIQEKNIKAHYNDYYRDYGETRGIIIRFSSARDSRLAMEYVNSTVGALTDSNSLEYFIALYNYYYSYRTQLTTSNITTLSDTLYRTDKSHAELSDISTSFQDFYNEALDDGDYTSIPRNIDGKYFMVLRYKTTYQTGTNDLVEFDNLISLGQTKKDEIIAQMKDEIIDSYATTSYANTLFATRLETADVKIYDPIFEGQFYTDYSDIYTLVKTSSTDTIFTVTYDNVTTTLKVDDFYKEQEAKSGVTTAMTFLTYDYCLDVYADKITSDALKEYKSDLKSAISTFKKGNDTIAKEMGTENFLLIKYGYKTSADVLNYYYKGKALVTYYLSDYIADSYINSDHSINENANIFQNFLTYTAKQFTSLFTIDIDHILIKVDDNCDGTPDDPIEFRAKLSTELQAEFDQAILDLTNALMSEVNFIQQSKLTAAKYLVEAYNQGLALVSTGYETKTWDDYKTKFNFTLTVESLGEVTQSTATSYVEEFRTYITDLFNRLVDNQVTISSTESIFYFLDNDADGVVDYSDICCTEYGYHIIMVNSYETASAPTFEADDDSDSEYATIKVIVDEGDDADDESDDIYFITNAYNSSTTNASISQLFIYFYEQNNGGVVSFNSNITSEISAIFSSVLSRYTDSTFQNYNLYKQLGTVTFADTTNDAKLTEILDIKERSIDSYSTNELFDGWFDLDWTK